MSQKSVAGSAAFQAAGVGKALTPGTSPSLPGGPHPRMRMPTKYRRSPGDCQFNHLSPSLLATLGS